MEAPIPSALGASSPERSGHRLIRNGRLALETSAGSHKALNDFAFLEFSKMACTINASQPPERLSSPNASRLGVLFWINFSLDQGAVFRHHILIQIQDSVGLLQIRVNRQIPLSHCNASSSCSRVDDAFPKGNASSHRQKLA